MDTNEIKDWAKSLTFRLILAGGIFTTIQLGAVYVVWDALNGRMSDLSANQVQMQDAQLSAQKDISYVRAYVDQSPPADNIDMDAFLEQLTAQVSSHEEILEQLSRSIAPSPLDWSNAQNEIQDRFRQTARLLDHANQAASAFIAEATKEHDSTLGTAQIDLSAMMNTLLELRLELERTSTRFVILMDDIERLQELQDFYVTLGLVSEDAQRTMALLRSVSEINIELEDMVEQFRRFTTSIDILEPQ